MKFRKGDIVGSQARRSTPDDKLRYKVLDVRKGTSKTVTLLRIQVVVDSSGTELGSTGTIYNNQSATLLYLVERKQSKKDRQIEELTGELDRVLSRERQVTKAAVENEQRVKTAQYLADKQLLDAGLVRIDFLREHAIKSGVRTYNPVAEAAPVTEVTFVDHNRSSTLFSQFVTKLKEKK